MTKRRIKKANDDSEFDSQYIAPSQESLASSNAQAEQQKKLLKALAELRRKEKAEKEKKTEKDKKFLQVIVKHLDRDDCFCKLTKATSIIEETMKAVEAEYSAFLSKYRVQESKIHNLWTQIQNEHENLMDIINEEHLRKEKAVARTASAHITALSYANSVCNESRKIIDSLMPPSASDWDSDLSDDDS